MLNIYFVDESTVLSEKDAWLAAWACNYQLQFQFGRSGWRSDVRAIYVPKGAQPSPSQLFESAVLHLLDTADQQGALGYHDEDGNEVPFARVFAKTSQDAGDVVSEVASHEALELAADPNVNLCAMDGQGAKLYAVEVGDPVQGTGYDVGAPVGRTTGITVANFALPAYFDPNSKPGTKVDYRGALQGGPFTISPQGYMSYVDLNNIQAGWQQAFGQDRKTPPPPDADDRVGRRVGVAQA